MQAKKSLGQNFLKNKKVVLKMIEKADLKKNDLVLEIGPGKGFLTKELLAEKIQIIALEKDHRMINFLKEKFFKNLENEKKSNLKIISGDALEINYQKLNLKNGKFKIVANLPYYITEKFLSNILSNKIKPEKMILLLQKEVVERITDKKKSSLLSLSVQAYGSVKKIRSVSKTNFSPQPKVDSAILEISEISKINFTSKNFEKQFFNFLKLSFSEKRKKMIKNLSKNFSPKKKKKLEKIFSSLNINLNIRAEDLQLESFLKIFKKLSTKL